MTLEPTERVLLSIDTSLGTSVALSAHGEVTELTHDGSRGHAEAIGVLLAEVFERTGVSTRAVTGVVVGIGPGPFTGLRVGVAAAHAFAAGLAVPVHPLHAHESVALAVFEGRADADGADVDGADGADAGVRVLQDARRREVFVTEYSGLDDDGIPVRVSGPRLEPGEHSAEQSGAQRGFDGDAVRHNAAASAPIDVWPERISGAAMLRLAHRRLDLRRELEPDRALYLRAPDAKPAAAAKRVSTAKQVSTVKRVSATKQVGA